MDPYRCPLCSIIIKRIFKDRFIAWVSQHSQALALTDIHVLMEDNDKDYRYPHNLLREILALDVDFVTPANASFGLQELLRKDEDLRLALHNKIWLVLPAFDRIMKDDVLIGEEDKRSHPHLLPESKLDALEMWQRKELEPFHMKKVSWGHGPTDFRSWYISRLDRPRAKEGSNQTVTSRPSFFSIITYDTGFEPYVLDCKACPEVFPKYLLLYLGQYLGKIAYFTGYEFGVLDDYFVVHLPHPYGKRRIEDEMQYEL